MPLLDMASCSFFPTWAVAGFIVKSDFMLDLFTGSSIQRKYNLVTYHIILLIGVANVHSHSHRSHDRGGRIRILINHFALEYERNTLSYNQMPYLLRKGVANNILNMPSLLLVYDAFL